MASLMFKGQHLFISTTLYINNLICQPDARPESWARPDPGPYLRTDQRVDQGLIQAHTWVQTRELRKAWSRVLRLSTPAFIKHCTKYSNIHCAKNNLNVSIKTEPVTAGGDAMVYSLALVFIRPRNQTYIIPLRLLQQWFRLCLGTV